MSPIITRTAFLIKTRRENLGMTQAELAKATGYGSNAFISDIERGKAQLPNKKIPIFAKVLGLKENDLQKEPKLAPIPIMPGPKGEELDGKSPGEIIRIYREARGLSESDLVFEIKLQDEVQFYTIEEWSKVSISCLKHVIPISNYLGIPEKKFFSYILAFLPDMQLSGRMIKYLSKSQKNLFPSPETKKLVETLKPLFYKLTLTEFSSYETVFTTLSHLLREIVYIMGEDRLFIVEMAKQIDEFYKRALEDLKLREAEEKEAEEEEWGKEIELED